MDINELKSELKFKASRSGGKGGQNVNKVETQMELSFDVLNSRFLSDEEKNFILSKLNNKINSQGILKITSQTERTQFMNKNICILKFEKLMIQTMKKPKIRKKTKISAAAKTANKISKKKHSEKKRIRKTEIDFDE